MISSFIFFSSLRFPLAITCRSLYAPHSVITAQRITTTVSFHTTQHNRSETFLTFHTPDTALPPNCLPLVLPFARLFVQPPVPPCLCPSIPASFPPSLPSSPPPLLHPAPVPSLPPRSLPASPRLTLQLLLQIADLALERADGRLRACLHLHLHVLQLRAHLLVLSLQQHPAVLQLLRARPLRRQLHHQLLHLAGTHRTDASTTGVNQRPASTNDRRQPTTGVNQRLASTNDWRQPTTAVNQRPASTNDRRQPTTGVNQRPASTNDRCQPTTGVNDRRQRTRQRPEKILR